jgi:hypothetical protein
VSEWKSIHSLTLAATPNQAEASFGVSNPSRMNWNLSFVPWCLRGEFSGWNFNLPNH